MYILDKIKIKYFFMNARKIQFYPNKYTLFRIKVIFVIHRIYNYIIYINSLVRIFLQIRIDPETRKRETATQKSMKRKRRIFICSEFKLKITA